MFAITPRGVGLPVNWRAVNSAADVLQGEFFFDGNPAGKVLAENGATLRDPTSDEALETAKRERFDEITGARNAALKSLTASWGGDEWDADEATSNRIASALSMIREASALGIPASPSIPWRTADNKDRTLTIAELTQMGAAVFLAQQMIWARQSQLKNTIAAASSAAEVRGVAW